MNKFDKKYPAIFFDWDGTAVMSRKAPADTVAAAMKPLLARGVNLVIVSGTTYDNIADGSIERYFTTKELKHLYLGLGRGAYNYCFEDGKPVVFAHRIPDTAQLLAIHDACYDIHRHLLETCHLCTDIVFSRPNYCKIDMMTENIRGDALFMQDNELDIFRQKLTDHGIQNGLQELIHLAEEIGRRHGLELAVTCDAKYLEVGISNKSSNVNTILARLQEEYGIEPSGCCFWGDEYVGLEDGIFGSDSFMKTPLSAAGDFFDVSTTNGERPEGVCITGGGVEAFLSFLKKQQ